MLLLLFQSLLLVSHLTNAKFLEPTDKPEKIFYDLEHAEDLFEGFIKAFGKTYEDEMEYSKRLQIFKENLLEVNKLNNASSHAVYGITHLHDLSPEEFHAKHTGCLSEINYEEVETISPKILINDAIKAPESFDWRDFGLVTEVKNQGICSSCWAFSATGAIEGQYAKKHLKLKSFSEQQLIDCNGQNGGCGDGWLMHEAFQYARDAGGVMTEGYYPYINGDQDCLFIPSRSLAIVTNGNLVAVQSEDQLKELLYQYGPLSIGIDASDWHYYSGGILKPVSRKEETTNHGVLLVGYGNDNGLPFWLIKNSWSLNWGEQGYIRIVRGQGACSINAYVAVVELL